MVRMPDSDRSSASETDESRTSDSDQESVPEVDQNRKRKSTLFTSELEDDDEVYIFECPSTMNPKSFLATEINLSHETKVEDKTTHQTFKVTMKPCVRTIEVIVPKDNGSKIAHVPVVGVLNADRRIRVKKHKLPADSENEVPFPTNLRSRHPLLGVNWQKQVKTSSKPSRKSVKMDKKGLLIS